MARRVESRGLCVGRLADVLVVLAVVSLLAAATGCATNSYVAARRQPLSPLTSTLQLASRKGPRSSERTTQLLRRYDLLSMQKEQSPQVLLRLQQELLKEPSADKAYALAELAFLRARQAEERRDAEHALDMYSVSVANAYMYLFDSRFAATRNAYDPQFRGACDLYNGALEGALRLVNRSGQLRPGATKVVHVGAQEYEVNVVARGPWDADEFERLEFVSDYEVEGLNNRHHTYGLGVPLIAVRRPRHAPDPVEQFYPPGLSYPVTAFLRVMEEPTREAGQPRSSGDWALNRGRAAASDRGHDEVADDPGQGATKRCVLELLDPIAASAIQVAGRWTPLETDLSTPLAYFLDNPALRPAKYAPAFGFFNPSAAPTGLYMLEPYDPSKIPVLMVHGLWSSPLTWMDMFNDLRSFPDIRSRYQFWFYIYPTGQPFWISAAQLRADLARTREMLDPSGRTPALDQMVLVGHSMGGLVSRLQTIDSGEEFWRTVSDQPFDELNASPEERAQLEQTFFFRANPSIRQVVTIGTPHHGSQFANRYTRWLSRNIIRMPMRATKLAIGLPAKNPGYFRSTQMLLTDTSIDSLAPDSPVLPALLAATPSPRVQYHSIIGLLPEKGLVGKFSAESDGVVSYESAHVDDAVSETLVESDHIHVHQHPRSTLAVREILKTHLEQIAREQSYPTTASPHLATPRRPLPTR